MPPAQSSEPVGIDDVVQQARKDRQPATHIYDVVSMQSPAGDLSDKVWSDIDPKGIARLIMKAKVQSQLVPQEKKIQHTPVPFAALGPVVDSQESVENEDNLEVREILVFYDTATQADLDEIAYYAKHGERIDKPGVVVGRIDLSLVDFLGLRRLVSRVYRYLIVAVLALILFPIVCEIVMSEHSTTFLFLIMPVLMLSVIAALLGYIVRKTAYYCEAAINNEEKWTWYDRDYFYAVCKDLESLSKFRRYDSVYEIIHSTFNTKQ